MTDDNLDLSSVKGSVVIVPAAGVGKRFGGELPKQYQLINNKPLLDITLELFLSSNVIDKVVLVISADDEHYKDLASITDPKIILIDGGDERQMSVHNALKFLYDNELPDDAPLLVHDAVRPCLSQRDFDALLSFYEKNKKACFLAERVSDSLKRIDQDGNVLADVERTDLVQALTPQMAPFIVMKNAFSSIIKSGILVTDEIGALTDYDIEAQAVFAQDPNPKITNKKDLLVAQQILIANNLAE